MKNHEELREYVKKALITACWINPENEEDKEWNNIPVDELVNNVVAMIQQQPHLKEQSGLDLNKIEKDVDNSLKELSAEEFLNCKGVDPYQFISSSELLDGDNLPNLLREYAQQSRGGELTDVFGLDLEELASAIYFGNNEDLPDTIEEAFREGITRTLDELKTLSQPQKEGWISCEDSLPEMGVEVLVYRPNAEKHGDSKIQFDKTRPEGSISWNNEMHPFSRINKPTHWQPLPTPPKQD